MSQTLFLVNRVHNVMGLFNTAMSNWVQRSNPERFKYKTVGPKNSRGYFLKMKNQDGIAENIPLPMLNSNSKIEELDTKYGYEMWRNPRLTPDHFTDKTMTKIFENEWAKLGMLPQRVIGTTEFNAQFSSYMEALDFQLELIAMGHNGKPSEPKEFRYYIEIPDKLVYFTEKGQQDLDMLSDGAVTYNNVYSINQKKFLSCCKFTPLLTPEFPPAPVSKLSNDAVDSFSVSFNVKWEIDLPMWLVFRTHFKVDSFSINIKFDFEAGGGMPGNDFTRVYTDGSGIADKYFFQEISQFKIEQTAFHKIIIDTASLPAWNDTDTIKVYINNEELSDVILANNEITFGKYMEKDTIIWVGRYSRQPAQTMSMLANAGGELLSGQNVNETIGF